MKIIIAGGRNFTDYQALSSFCNSVLRNQSDVEIVSGTARGADQLGERYAKEKGYPIKQFPANWKEYGRAAGPIRNKEMAEYADGLIAFWDGQSPGTRSMIELAKESGLKVRVHRFKG